MNRYQVRVIETTVYRFEAETEEEARRIASEDCIWGPSEGKLVKVVFGETAGGCGKVAYDVWIDVEDLEEAAL